MKSITVKSTFIYACLLLTLFSCKKKTNDDLHPGNETYPDYSALSIGNYWIYNIYDIDESGKETLQNGITDSVVIAGDTIIRGHRYFIKKTFENHQLSFTEILRDSLQYTVNPIGEILFSSKAEHSIFRTYYQVYGGDTACRVDFRMDDNDTAITVPAGTFMTKTLKTFVYIYPLNDPQYNRVGYYRYSMGIGLIHYNVFYSGAKIAFTDFRLSRYFVK